MDEISLYTVEDFIYKIKKSEKVTILGKVLCSTLQEDPYGYGFFGYLSNTGNENENNIIRFFISNQDKNSFKLTKKLKNLEHDKFLYITGTRGTYKGKPQLQNITTIKNFKNNQDTELPIEIKHIGLVTGKSSRAKKDFKNILNTYIPNKISSKTEVSEVDLKSPKESPTLIANAIDIYSNKKSIDAICIMRGGGTFLNIFDNSRIIKSILNAQKNGKYIITGLGHAEDFTLSDLFANLSANTPTDAAYKFVMYFKNKAILELKKKLNEVIQSTKI